MLKERQEFKLMKGNRSTISEEDSRQQQNFRRFSDDEGGIYKHARTSSCGSAGSQGKIYKISKAA